MKSTFTTVDIAAIVNELQNSLLGYRVNQIYDVDHKTYLIKFQKPESKVVLLLESASRIHTTDYEWPKSPAPSGFAMKLRKHLRNKRLEAIEQLGVDRIVDLCFGSGEAAHHLIVELYDRGNIVLTDFEYNILNVLRPRKEGQDTKISVRETYPIASARKARSSPNIDQIREAIVAAKPNTNIKKVLNPLVDCGGGALDHELRKVGLHGAKVGKDIKIENSLEVLQNVAGEAQKIFQGYQKGGETKGFIIKKIEKRPKGDGTSEDVLLYEEFHPRLYAQHCDSPHQEFCSFNAACDEFFSNMEANQLDKKTLQKEKEAMKKLENVRKDHEKRLTELKGRQEVDRQKGQLIELNQQLVEGALLVVRSAVANQIDWKNIRELLDEAQARQDPIACSIKELKLEKNMITLWLSDPYSCDENDLLLDSDEEREGETSSEISRPIAVDIDLDLSAFANARCYYNLKRQAAQKEQKTLDASVKAIKSAEKKTQQTLKEVSNIAIINKARKVHWFEKYLWFISSENYLVIAGRDGQQNEQVVKRHLKPRDIYVHADLHGAASVVVKNPSNGVVPPTTLHEAGIMALCYSKAWAEKVVTSAWWVYGHQVSKTAPAGEYLTTGAFMVRGKRNFLPPSHLVFGFGLLFRLEESSVQRHEGERKVKSVNDGVSEALASVLDRLSTSTYESRDEEVELVIENDSEGASDEENGQITDVRDDIHMGDDFDDSGHVDISDGVNHIGCKDGVSSDALGVGREIVDQSKLEVIEETVEITESNSEHLNTGYSNMSNIESGRRLPYKEGGGPNSYLAFAGGEECAEGTDRNLENTADEMVKCEAADPVEFPDTVIEMSHIEGGQFTLRTKVSELDETAKQKELGSKSKHIEAKNKITKEEKNNWDNMQQNTSDIKADGDDEKANLTKPGVLKRGQKGKLKKLKKYRYQDEEERELSMKLLHETQKETRIEKKKKAAEKAMKNAKSKKVGIGSQKSGNLNTNRDSKKMPTGGAFVENQPAEEKENRSASEIKEEKLEKSESTRRLEEETDELDEVDKIQDDLSILDSLTALPFAEDELLYAVPVCAPYSVMGNYKYKVKLTPGTGKKGKACKTALHLFLQDKNSSTREKDLLRAIKDYDMARNVPGKVKVSAPNISKMKK